MKSFLSLTFKSCFHFLPCLTLIFSIGCAHKNSFKNAEDHLSEVQIDQLNRKALGQVSDRLEALILKSQQTQTDLKLLSSDLFLKANMSLLHGDYTTASVLFKHLLNIVPHDEFIRKKYVISLIKQGDLETARVILEKLYLETKDEKLGLILAGIHSGLDNDVEARKIYRKILASHPTNEDACIFLGKSLMISQKSHEAISQLETCARKDNKNGIYDYYVGKIQMDLGNVPLAIKSFKSSYQKQPNLGQSVVALGILMEEKNQEEAAVSLYKKYLNKNPDDSFVLNRIIQILFVQEKFKEVIPYAERLVDLEPENLNLKVKLGIIYTDSRKYSEAISIFKDLLVVAPDSDKILYYLGGIKQEIQEYLESIEHFSQIRPSSGLYLDSSIQIANMLSTLAISTPEGEDRPELEHRFFKFVNTKAEELSEFKLEFNLIKAGHYEASGNYKEAIETVISVQDEKKFTTNHKYYLANLYEKQKKFKESTELVMGIINAEPSNAHAWNFLGYSLLERGEEFEKAYDYIQRALKLKPDDGYIRDSLGWYYFKTGKTKKALIELEFAIKKVPDDLEIAKHLAIVHKKLKNFIRAKNYFKLALRHARFESDKDEIISHIKEIEGERGPASN